MRESLSRRTLKFEALTSAKAELESQISISASDLSEAQSQNASADTQIKDYQNQIMLLSAQLAEVTNARDALTAEKLEKEEKISTLQKEIDGYCDARCGWNR